MTSRDVYAWQLLALYRDEIKNFLAEYQGGKLEALDQNAELLERALAQTGDLKVGFVGEAQVGKSTLINGLLDRLALPSGGIGPLTAQATRVVHAAEDSLSVTYHTRQALNQHAFAIRAYLKRRGDLVISSEDESVEGEATAGMDSEDAVEWLTVADAKGEESQGSYRSERGEYMLDQAKRILHFDNPDAPDVAPSGMLLLEGMRAIIGQKSLSQNFDLSAYQKRIEEVQALLGTTEELTQSTLGGPQAFNRALKARAAGWASPLVAQLQLRLSSSLLEGLSLIDLPGIGVLNDPAGKEAERFVRTEGDALVVVFRNSGVTESIAELLERTGVITKLLFGGSNDLTPIQLLVAVTHLDDVARDRFRARMQEARESGEPAPDRHEIFRELSAEMESKLKEQIADALRRSKAFEDLPEDQRKAREAVVKRLSESMNVVCITAPDYLNLSLGYTDGSEFLKDQDITGVPELRRHLLGLAREAKNRRSQAISQFERALRQAIRDHLAAVAQIYEEGRGAAMQEWDRFRDALIKVAEPLRQEMQAYHGEAVGVLRKAMQAELQMICKDAEIAGMKKLQRLTREGRGMHYASLNAALSRGGRWERREINYPQALTLAMVDSIAAQWEPKVIEKVREEVRILADRDVKLVQQLCDAAEKLNQRIVSESSIESQKKILQTNSRTAIAWTREQLEDLRKSVSEHLRDAVEGPILKACKKALQAGANRGTGAKDRILEAFEEGGNDAIQEARKRAEGSLKEHYGALLRKLNEGFLKDNHDPVQASLDVLIGEQVAKAKRSDSHRRRQVNTKIEGFSKALSELDSARLPAGESRWDSAHV